MEYLTFKFSGGVVQRNIHQGAHHSQNICSPQFNLVSAGTANHLVQIFKILQMLCSIFSSCIWLILGTDFFLNKSEHPQELKKLEFFFNDINNI
jgi:hypothetical protein